MKFPEHCLTMEAGLPSPVYKWLTQELEQLGIDSLIYTRYIISLLLHQGIEDLDWYDDDDMFCNRSKLDKFKKKGKKQEQKSIVSEEEAKKTAVIDCLSRVSEQKTGIESLVEELCTKLKEKETEPSHNQTPPSTSDSSEDSGTENQNPVDRYYAAFPSLNNQDLLSTPSQSPSVSLWRKNPLTKTHSISATNTPGYESGSPSVDAEVRKIVSCKLAVPKHRKQKKNPNRNNNRSSQERRKNIQKPPSAKSPNTVNSSGKPVPYIQNWPPGFAKTDPYVLQNIDMYGNKLVLRSDIKRPQDEICTQVETILKGYLLPAPEKTYKELQDVDTKCQIEQRERVKKIIVKEEVAADPKSDMSPLIKQHEKCIEGSSQKTEMPNNLSRESSMSKQSCGESISPELQEQEIWYTQPIDVIFLCQDEEPQQSKLRLYKRNSFPSLSAETPNTGDVQKQDYLYSSSPSAIDKPDSRSSPDSDFILQSSDLIPAWLTEELLADFDDEIHTGKSDEASSFKTSSPNPALQQSGSDIFRTLEKVLDQTDHTKHDDESPRMNRSGSSTPTCEPIPVSLLGLEYLSNFGQDYNDGFLYDNLTPPTLPRRYSFSSWQSRVLLDNLSSSDEFPKSSLVSNTDNPCWQPLEVDGSCLTQLWDVNMQKRTKVSSWEQPIVTAEKIWCSENMLIFHVDAPNLGKDFAAKIISENQNTLIPQISIDMHDYPQNEYDYVQDDGDDEDDDDDGTDLVCPPNFDKSVSLGDIYRWVDNSQRNPDPQLSKSFDLVPSEYSAFCDVQRKLVHVHSEPNLVQFRQDFLDGNQSKATSPLDNLLVSPKTHFRPITPAYAPELSSSSKAQYVLNDLFGGLPHTKTPLQQFHMNDGDSEEEAFIPKFKLKNLSKSIQTGESFDNANSSDIEDDVDDSEMRDTPETLTLGIIEDVMGDKDEDYDLLVPISEDCDTANTDSAYETDYSVPIYEYGQDGLHYGCHVCQEQMNCDMFLADQNAVKKPDVGNVIDYNVKSLQATYPHTQDWPDMSQSLTYPADSGQYWNCDWQSHSYHGYPFKNSWLTDDFLSAGDTDDEGGNKEQLRAVCVDLNDETDLFDNWVGDEYTVPYTDEAVTAGSWVDDFGGNLLFEESGEAIYPVTWSSFDKDDVFSETTSEYTPDVHGFQTHYDTGEDASLVDNLFNTELVSSVLLENKGQNEGQLDEDTAIPCQRLKVFSSQFFSADDAENTESKDERSSVEGDSVKHAETIGVDLELVHIDDDVGGVLSQQLDNEQSELDVFGHPCGDYYRVKLVYKDTIREPWKYNGSKGQGSERYGVKPLPDDAKLSTELEREWLDLDLQLSSDLFIPSRSQRKPCSFFLEGNCRRSDCKFAHDIANITCRFWEEGGCFKGPLCPFLHGYPSVMSSNENSSKNFDLHREEFPELNITSENSNVTGRKDKSGIPASSNKERVTRTPSRQPSGSASKREKHRKQNNRRHSNKENRIELCILDKCSSSI